MIRLSSNPEPVVGKKLKWYKREGVGGCLKGLQSRLKWMDAFCRQKGVEHALDHIV